MHLNKDDAARVIGVLLPETGWEAMVAGTFESMEPKVGPPLFSFQQGNTEIRGPVSAIIAVRLSPAK
jgi:hypothetical protein